ncbi:MAG: preprotein translocase subunit SecG [Roseibacillus sp.]|jgi:preprotein translocase subunit SecG
MILADSLDITISLLLVAHVVVSLLLILVVLMQRPKQEGLGAAFGAGVTDQMFGAQTTNVLQKGTAYFGTAFLVLSLVLAILIGKRNFEKGIVETPPPETSTSAAPDVPAIDPEGGKELDLNSLKKALEGAPPTPTPGTTPPKPTEPTPEPAPAPSE